jgi:hypothetical protein
MECCFSRVEPTRGWDASLLLILLLFSYTPITARRPSSELRECVRQHWSKTKEGKKRPKLGKKRGIRFSAALSLFELFFFCFRFVPCVIRWVVFVYWKEDRSYRHHKNDTLTHTNTVKKKRYKKKKCSFSLYITHLKRHFLFTRQWAARCFSLCELFFFSCSSFSSALCRVSCFPLRSFRA